ncbi:MAG: hypothetical protein IT371_08160 [Deltaproteobacteria bacterium]|nr:hypothetical protein [Deltaproteobacteria bacterium]
MYRRCGRAARRADAFGRAAVFVLASGLLQAVGPHPTAFGAEARSTVQLLYQRGPGAGSCPGDEALARAVESRLGYRPWSARPARWVHAEVAADGEGLRARVTLRSAGGARLGERVLRAPSPDCRELAAAMALAISIAIDPWVAPGDGGGAPRAPAPRPAAVSPPPEPRRELRAASTSPVRSTPAVQPTPALRARPRSLALAIAAGPFLSVGAAPSPNAGLRVDATLRFGRTSVGLEGRVDLPVGKDLEPGRLSTALLMAAALGCGHLSLVSACVLLGGGALRVNTSGLERSAPVTLGYAAGALRLGLEVPLGAVLGLRAHTDLWAPFSQTELRETGTGRVFWAAPAVWGSFGLSLLGRFL